MKVNDLKKRCREYIQQLTQEIKNQRSHKKIIEYLNFCSRFHRYSFHNTILIWTHKPNATFVAGFRKWHRLGRYIKKGEKGIPIFAPLIIKTKAQKTDPFEDEEEEEEVIRYKVVYVWDISQTEGKPIPQAPDIKTVSGKTDLLPQLENVAKSYRISVKYSDIEGKYGISTGGEVVILKSLSDEEKFHTLVHEIAHELLHQSPDGRALPKKLRELEAEATAYVVCRHFNLNPPSPSYLALYQVEEIEICSSLNRILNTSSNIIQTLEARLSKDILSSLPLRPNK